MGITSINGLQQPFNLYQPSIAVRAAGVTRFPQVPIVENTQPIIIPPDPKHDSIINEMAMLDSLQSYTVSIIKNSLFNTNQAKGNDPLMPSMAKSVIPDAQAKSPLASLQAAPRYDKYGHLTGVDTPPATLEITA
jgi:hypothetical protein